MSDYTFSPNTPIYHEAIDDWGLAAGTRVWEAGGSFVPVQALKEGDYVFGITYRLEDTYVPIEAEPSNPMTNIVKVWSPVLVARRVLAVRTVVARSWQLTFGDSQKQYEARRLVAGGDTQVCLFPLTHEFTSAKRLVDCKTTVPNPRTGADERRAMELDVEWSQEVGKPMYRPTPFTGTPRGEHVVIIPYEHYGGQTGLLRSDVRGYNRYLFTQAREVVPLQTETTLYQVELQHDVGEEYAAFEPRCNMIAQTPFAPDKEKRSIFTDDLANEVMNVTDVEDFERRWDEWAKGYGQSKRQDKQKRSEVSTVRQGMFYDSQQDQSKAKALKDWYGIDGGWLNGGILINVPVPNR